MSNNSCRYINSKLDQNNIKKLCKKQAQEMSRYIPYFKYIFMPHRYKIISSMLPKIKKICKKPLLSSMSRGLL